MNKIYDIQWLGFHHSNYCCLLNYVSPLAPLYEQAIQLLPKVVSYMFPLALLRPIDCFGSVMETGDIVNYLTLVISNSIIDMANCFLPVAYENTCKAH